MMFSKNNLILLLRVHYERPDGEDKDMGISWEFKWQ